MDSRIALPGASKVARPSLAWSIAAIEALLIATLAVTLVLRWDSDRSVQAARPAVVDSAVAAARGSYGITGTGPGLTTIAAHQVPSLGFQDDFATRHMADFVPTAPGVSFRDDLATRSADELGMCGLRRKYAC